MIQRIQTIYLILIAGIMLAMLFLSVSSIPMCLIYGLTTISALVAVFYYKKRALQINICYLTLGLIILSYVVNFITTGFPTTESFSSVNSIIVMALPLIAIILDLLAIRGIKKDDKLVRSLDRLR